MARYYLTFLISGLLLSIVNAQQVSESQLGAWYMYYYTTTFKTSNWGIQGDIQYRDWRGLGDREQLLLCSGVIYKVSYSK